MYIAGELVDDVAQLLVVAKFVSAGLIIGSRIPAVIVEPEHQMVFHCCLVINADGESWINLQSGTAVGKIIAKPVGRG